MMALPESRANHVLEDLGIKSPKDLTALELVAWARGAMVEYGQLSGAEARVSIVGGKAIIVVSSKVSDSHRRRFAIAHELGHFEMHVVDNTIAFCTSEDLDTWTNKQNNASLEHEANEFAAALLLPEKLFAPLCGVRSPRLEAIAELAEIFDVSLTATALRYIRFTQEACAVVFTKDELVRWFQGSKEFVDLGAFIEVKVKPDPLSLVARFFNGKAVPAEPRRVSIDTWLEPGDFRHGAKLLEQSWPMPQYNAVLTLLWIDEDVADKELDEDDDD